MAQRSELDATRVVDREDADEKAEDPGPDDADELFDVVDENNDVVDTATRGECHEKGLLHRSTHLLLFRTATRIGEADTVSTGVEVLLQRRAEGKKVGGGLWDLSVAEHVSSGEDYACATARGAQEELSLHVREDDLLRLRAPYLSRQAYPDASVLDYMFTATFAAVYEPHRMGDVACKEDEVGATRWWPVEEVARRAQKEPDEFTRWFLIELKALDIVQVGKMMAGEF